MRTEQVNEMIADITRQLLQKRSSDGIWRGCLSSSAISTSVAIFALYQIDSDTYEPYIRKGAGWLRKRCVRMVLGGIAWKALLI